LNKNRLERIIKAQIKVNRIYQVRLTDLTRKFELLENVIPDENKKLFREAVQQLREVSDDYDYDILNELFTSFLKLLKESSISKFISSSSLIKSIFKGVF
jgi:hypothetical protein